jgi:soluble lytic murein transglycosylase
MLAVGVAGVLAYTTWVHWRDESIEERLRRYDPAIRRCAAEQDLPPELIRAVIRAESGAEPTAENPRTRARGLMQLLPDAETDAIKRLRIPRGDLFDGGYNIRVGSAYLRMMLDRFDGEVWLAVAAYNWGPGNVERIRREHPGLSSRALIEQFAPAETRKYCAKVIAGR